MKKRPGEQLGYEELPHRDKQQKPVEAEESSRSFHPPFPAGYGRSKGGGGSLSATEGYGHAYGDGTSPLYQQISLFNHQDPRVRLRAVACLHAHVDLPNYDAAGRDRLSEALHRQLWREENPHVAQQIVRVLASIVILSCKHEPGYAFDSELNLNPNPNCSTEINLSPQSSRGGNPNLHSSTEINLNYSPTKLANPQLKPNFRDSTHTPYSHSNPYSVEEDAAICEFCKQRAEGKTPQVSNKVSFSTSEPARHVVNTLLSYLHAETLPLSCLQSLTLKLQILRSLHRIAEETGAIQLVALSQLTKLLANSSPVIRARTLQLIAMVMATDSGAKSLPGKEDSVGLFEEYTHDPDVSVRKAALHSLILLHSKGYLLTKGCYIAALALLQDLHERVRSLALQVIGSWVEQEPEEHTNNAFIQVCKLMIDMEFSVRIEACKTFSAMRKVREDLLLQALSKQPLGLSAKEKEPSPSSLITIPESDVDVSTYEQGLSILDKLNMGAFVHGIEDEFYEVRALTVQALATLCDCSPKARATILEVMMNMLSDDSQHVRLNALHALIHVAHRYGLLVKDNDLHTLHGTLEDIHGDIRDSGKRLLAKICLPSADSFKCTIQSLMNHMQKGPQDDGIMHALYRLGKAHSTYVQLLAKDLLKELKVYLLSDEGLDAPGCACILTLFMAASESDANLFSFVPSYILSLTRLLRQNTPQKYPMLEVDFISPQAQIFRWLEATGSGANRHLNVDAVFSMISTQRKRVEDFLSNTTKAAWNVKSMLDCGMGFTAKQVLSGCRRDLKLLLGMLGDEDQVALTTFALHYVECIALLLQGRAHFQQKRSLMAAPMLISLPELSCRLEFIVKCMQHAYVGLALEQKFDLLELSMIPAIWRIASMAGKADERDHNKLVSAMESIEKIIGLGLSYTPFMQGVQENLLKAVASCDTVNVCRVVRQLASSFWPKILPISNFMRELKAELTVPGNDFDRPLPFVPGVPLGITVSVFTQNANKSRIWLRMQVNSLWTEFMFLDAEDHERVNPMVTTMRVHGVPSASKCTLKAAVLLECPVMAHEAVVRGPKGFLLPLTPEKVIHLVSTSTDSIS